MSLQINCTYYSLDSISENGAFEGCLGFYLLESNSLKRISFDHRIHNNQRKWFISNFREICKVDNEQNLLDEFFEKDKTYSEYKSTKEYYRFVKIDVRPGFFYPRIYRPILIYDHDLFFISPSQEIRRLKEELNEVNDFLPIDRENVLTGVTQLSLLIENLKAICRTIHPSNKNLTAYGNEIRNLLILSCTEVEAQLRGIYCANYSVNSDRLSTNEFVLLNDVLKLKHYKVQFNLYPWLTKFCPFFSWDAKNPTKSLSWYESYNSVKHNRENDFEKGNLENVLNAITAFAILLRAQYGPDIPYWKELIGRFLIFSEIPSWKFEERYLPPMQAETWREKRLQNQ